MRRPSSSVTFATVNVSTAARLYEELKRGGELAGCDYIGVQETALHGEALAQAEGTIKQSHWSGFLDEAYRKNAGFGGGTAVLSRHPAGVRRFGIKHGLLKGRCSVGCTFFGQSLTCASFYGLSGGSLGAQLPYWRELADHLLALGRPFVVMGDWQRPPSDLRSSGLCRLLDAEVCAPSCATNLTSGGKLDFFLVSRSLLAQGWHVRPLHGCSFRPHIPVVLHINLKASVHATRRIRQPRLLPIERPGSVHLPGAVIDWSAWAEGVPGMADGQRHDVESLTRATETWYAGAEAELATLFGVFGTEEEKNHLGMGLPHVVVQESSPSRFSSTPDVLGILGQRLDWALRGLHLVLSLGPAVIQFHALADANRDEKEAARVAVHVDTLSRIGHRAAAFAAEAAPSWGGDDVDAFWPLARRGFKFLASLVRSRHRKRPMLLSWRSGSGTEDMAAAARISQELDDAYRRLAASRHKKARAELRKWAMSAQDGVAHRVTKAPKESLAFSASASKRHLGERTPQAAADAGATEWGAIWNASEVDQSDPYMEAISELDFSIGDADWPVIPLPPILPERIAYMARRVKASTGVGGDWARMRHIAWLSRPALRALACWFEEVEKVGRWPTVIRTVIEIALSKKGGGARLIGLASTLYRLWARLRYDHVRAILEARLARPELAAAPGRGAAHTIFEASFAAEAASARGLVVATSAVDISKYYEYVEVSEFLAPAKRLGIPRQLIALAANFYLGPRRLRVGKAVSALLHPRRSIVAGCTWCTVLIRVIVLAPLDSFARQLRAVYRRWNAELLLRLYIDDGMITSIGHREAVAHLHVSASALLISWITNVLKKMVATPKLVCIAPDAELRSILRSRLRPMGYDVVREGELLGADFSGGAPFRTRRQQRQRRRGALARRRRLKWWAKSGGNSGQVVSTGAIPSVVYSMESCGLPPPIMRDLRKLRGAFARVKSGGASLTAKLATAGHRYCDADPAVLYVAPPFRAIHEMLWDFPRTRFHFIFAWRKAVREIVETDGSGWNRVAGPVSAAMCHLMSIKVRWEAPFRLTIDEDIVQLLEVPPSHVYAVLRDRARLMLDVAFIRRLAVQKGWERTSVDERYANGIDWDFVRVHLRSPALTPTKRRALQVLSAGAFWSDERRWLAGYQATPGCSICQDAVGDDAHYFAADCEAVQVALTWERIAGRPHATPPEFSDPALSPLTELGLPPRSRRWRPIQPEDEQGFLTMGYTGRSYGDGSGFRQQSRTERIATWAVVRLDDQGRCIEHLRGVVPGYFSTVPRGEILALLNHLLHAGPAGVYVGDCQHVLDAVRYGVCPRLLLARGKNPDLWAKVKVALEDHGTLMPVVKVKAHSSRNSALAMGTSAEDWDGNDAADRQCRQLARQIMERDSDSRQALDVKAAHGRVLSRLLFVMHWSFRYRPQFAVGVRKRRRIGPSASVPEGQVQGHVIVSGAKGRQFCRICRREAWGAAGLRRLTAEGCQGPVGSQCHHSHSTLVTNGVLWCRLCGAYTTRRPRALARACPRRPVSEAAVNVRNRLARGLLPTTASYLAQDTFQGVQGGGGGDHSHPHEHQLHGTQAGAAAAPPPVPAPVHPRPYGYRNLPRRSQVALPLRGTTESNEGLGSGGAGVDEAAGGSVSVVLPRGTRGNQPSLVRLFSGAQHRRVNPCLPGDGESWTQRLSLGATAVAQSCHICGSPCRGRCRGCSMALCIACARARVHCPVAGPSADAAGRRQPFDDDDGADADDGSRGGQRNVERRPRPAARTVGHVAAAVHGAVAQSAVGDDDGRERFDVDDDGDHADVGARDSARGIARRLVLAAWTDGRQAVPFQGGQAQHADDGDGGRNDGHDDDDDASGAGRAPVRRRLRGKQPLPAEIVVASVPLEEPSPAQDHAVDAAASASADCSVLLSRRVPAVASALSDDSVVDEGR